MNLAFSDWHLGICEVFLVSKILPTHPSGTILSRLDPPTRWPRPDDGPAPGFQRSVSMVTRPLRRAPSCPRSSRKESDKLGSCSRFRPRSAHSGLRALEMRPVKRRAQAADRAPTAGGSAQPAESNCKGLSPPAEPPQGGYRGHFRPQVRILIRLPVSVQRRLHPKAQHSGKFVLQRVGGQVRRGDRSAEPNRARAGAHTQAHGGGWRRGRVTSDVECLPYAGRYFNHQTLQRTRASSPWVPGSLVVLDKRPSATSYLTAENAEFASPTRACLCALRAKFPRLGY